MKNINIPLEDERHKDLEFIQEFYSKRNGVKLTKTQTLKILLFETANLIRNTGNTHPEIKNVKNTNDFIEK